MQIEPTSGPYNAPHTTEGVEAGHEGLAGAPLVPRGQSGELEAVIDEDVGAVAGLRHTIGGMGSLGAEHGVSEQVWKGRKG